MTLHKETTIAETTIASKKHRHARTAVASLAATAALFGAGHRVITNYKDNVAENQAQPSCEFPVGKGEGLGSVQKRMRIADDLVHGPIQIETSRGLDTVEVQKKLPFGSVTVANVATEACVELNGVSVGQQTGLSPPRPN